MNNAIIIIGLIRYIWIQNIKEFQYIESRGSMKSVIILFVYFNN